MISVQIGWRERKHSDIIRAGVIAFYAEQGNGACLTPASAMGTLFKLSNKTFASYVKSNKTMGYQRDSNEPTKEGVNFAIRIFSKNIGSQCLSLKPSERVCFERAPRFLKILQNYGSYDPTSRQ